MDITVEEFLEHADPILYSKSNFDIYYSLSDKYHWYCVVKSPMLKEPKLFEIDFEFGDMDEFIDKIYTKIQQNKHN